MTTRHRRVRRETSDAGIDGNVGMGDVTDATLPEAVPRNADGTASEEGEVSEEQAQLIGSLSLESAAKNRGVSRRLRDKALGKKGVAWNVDDALEMFSYIRSVFAAEWNSIVVNITRIEPAPRVQLPPIMAANLKDQKALYDYVELHHGSQGPATYKIYFRAGGGSERGAASIYMPDKSAPPVVQVVSQSQQQQQPQYAPQQYQPPPSYGGGYGSTQGGPPQGSGYWPQQPAQQPPQGDRIVVISPPQQQPQPQQAAPSPPPPQPIYMPPPPPAPGAWDPQRAVIEMMQTQNAATMAALKEIVDNMRKPQPPPPPPGFIAIPDGYPLPPGYFRVPGGMIPGPTPAMYAPQPQPQPQGVGAQPQPVAYAAPAPASVAIQAPPVSFDAQVAGTVKMMSGVMRGMHEMQSLFASFGAPGGGGARDLEEPEPPQPPNPMITQDVGGITMAIDRATGKTNWAATAMGAIPKIVDAAKSGLSEYQKLMDRHAAQAAKVMADRTTLANAIAAAKGQMHVQQQPALPPMQRVAPPPQVQAAPVPAAPPHAPAPTSPARRNIAVPVGPLWPTS